MDSTHNLIMQHLEITKQMSEMALGKLNGRETDVNISVLPDLGISNNGPRMTGGFYTGLHMQWDTETPFIPIDATLNVCGVSVYKIYNKFTYDDFICNIKNAGKMFEQNNYIWNFNNGNHFIVLAEDEIGEKYLFIHSSNPEYKQGKLTLYDNGNAWFKNDIKTLRYKDRIFRYIHGSAAERFYNIYRQAESDKEVFQDIVAEYIMGKENFSKCIYSQHYGMPNRNAIAIGCQWHGVNRVMLSDLGKDIYFISCEDEQLTAHGFGVELICPNSIAYKNGQLYINESLVTRNVLNSEFTKTRYCDCDVDSNFIEKTFNVNVTKVFSQIACYNKKGFYKF